MESFENMSKKAKIILSIIGISAVLVPAALLMFVSQNTQVPPQANDAPRQIDQINVPDQKNAIPTPPPVLNPTPSPVIATPSPATSGLESIPVSR
jgi:hypothetical protein